MIQIYYNGYEITESVAINRCYHDMYASGRTDTVNLRLVDASNLWDAWAPASGDEIEVEYGTISTGAMFISSVVPENGVFTIAAQAAPFSGFDKQNKAWQKVRLLQIGREIADRNGLAFTSYGVEDRLYSYILQEGEGDFRFLHRIAAREGCAILIYNKTLVLYDERYMEAIEPTEVLDLAIDGEYKFHDRRFNLYGACVVESGMYAGRYTADNGSNRVYTAVNLNGVGSNDEAERYAKNLLRSVNKDCYCGYIRSHILPGYSAASMVELQNTKTPSWNGPVFIDHIRNDYEKGQSKIFFRKPLEGY